MADDKLDLDAIESGHAQLEAHCACAICTVLRRVRELETTMRYFNMDVDESVAVWKREA